MSIMAGPRLRRGHGAERSPRPTCGLTARTTNQGFNTFQGCNLI